MPEYLLLYFKAFLFNSDVNFIILKLSVEARYIATNTILFFPFFSYVYPSSYNGFHMANFWYFYFVDLHVRHTFLFLWNSLLILFWKIPLFWLLGVKTFPIFKSGNIEFVTLYKYWSSQTFPEPLNRVFFNRFYNNVSTTWIHKEAFNGKKLCHKLHLNLKRTFWKLAIQFIILMPSEDVLTKIIGFT